MIRSACSSSITRRRFSTSSRKPLTSVGDTALADELEAGADGGSLLDAGPELVELLGWEGMVRDWFSNASRAFAEMTGGAGTGGRCCNSFSCM